MLERECVFEKLASLGRRSALCAETSEHRRRLWREPDVTHDRNTRSYQGEHAGDCGAGALDLHRVGAGLLQEVHAVSHRFLVGDLERAEGHVGHDERSSSPARDRAREHDHLSHRRRHRRLVSEHGHRRGIADEDDVDTGGVRNPAAGEIVRRDHHDRVAAPLHADEICERKLACSFGTAGHASSPSRRTLSMSRVRPTRAAATRCRRPLNRASSTYSGVRRGSVERATRAAASASAPC